MPVKASKKYSFAVEFISSIYPVSEKYKEILTARMYHRNLKKGEILVSKGEVCTFICFIKKGLIRGYIENAKGDITTWISGEKELVTSITGFFKNKPAKENIQVIEASVVECLTVADLEYLYAQCPEQHIVTRLILERYYEDAENRAFIARLPTAAEKYNHLLESESYVHLLNRAPLKYIASFLGIRNETLSRLRKKYSTRR